MHRHLFELKQRMEHFIKADISYLVRGGFYLSLGQGAAAISGFLLTLGLVRLLDQSEYGLYSYIISIAGIVSAFTLSGMDTAVAQEVARGNERALTVGFFAKLRWSIPIAIITVGAGCYYLFKDNAILGISLIMIGATAPFLYASSLYAVFFNGKKQFGKIAKDNIFKNAAITALILIMAYTTRDVLWVIGMFVFSNTLISLCRYLVLVRAIPKRTNDASEEALTLGKHLSAMDIFSVTSTYIDKILVFQLLGSTPLALYAIALAPVKQIQNLSKILKTLILPKFSERSFTELRNTVGRRAVLVFIASLCVVVAYCLCAPFIFTYIFPTYHEAIPYTQFLSLTILTIPSTLHTQILISHHRKRELYILNTTKPFIRIALLFILIPSYGIWGVAVSYVLFYAVHNAMILYLFYRIPVVDATN